MLVKIFSGSVSIEDATIEANGRMVELLNG